MDTFLYPLLLMLAGIFIFISSVRDIVTGKDEREHITRKGINLSIVGAWVGPLFTAIGFVWGILWLLFNLRIPG